MQVVKEKDGTERESKVREITLRAATAVSILLTGLLFSLVVPLWPRELMVLLAIGLGALAYKFPTPAVMLMLILVLPGYLYQLSFSLPAGANLPIPIIGAMVILLLIVAALASATAGALGIIAGAAAAILMITPLQLMALPIIIGVILFRIKGRKTRAASAIFTFAILYYPILAINSGVSPGGLVPIFEPVPFTAQQPIAITSLKEISATLSNVMDTTSTQGTRIYLDNLGDYWPLSFGQRLIPVGVLFCLLAGAAIATAQGTLALFGWLRKREVSSTYLPLAVPVLALLAGIVVFVIFADILAQPLNYSSNINIALLLVGVVIVGGSGSLAEVWLRKRDHILEMRDRLSNQAIAMHEQTDLLTDRIRMTKAQCHQIDTSEEEALCQICQQELSFAEQAVSEMSLIDLEQKVTGFQKMQLKLDEVWQESSAKLNQYYDNDRQNYNDHMIRAKRYGFDIGDSIDGAPLSQLSSMEYNEVLKLQGSLNAGYQRSAQLLNEEMKKLEERLCSEVDPDFKRDGIHIARDYFTQDCCPEALREFLQELGDIEHFLSGTMAGLDKDIVDIAKSLKEVVVDVLMPTAVDLGDVKGVSYYRQALNEMASLYDAPVENAALPDMMRTVTKMSQLGEIMASLSSNLGEKLAELESSIRDKTPRGYSWGVDPNIQTRVSEVSETIRKASNPIAIYTRMTMLKTGPSVVKSAAHTVKDYSIARELLINYANIEHLVEDRIRKAGTVISDDLPVKRKYARNYLQLYCLKHPGDVCIETDTGRLTRI